MKAIITGTPCRVPVSDSRGFVPGSRIVVCCALGLDELEDVGLVIPPEGDCPEAWLGDLASLPEELYGELECAAREGAEGRSFYNEVFAPSILAGADLSEAYLSGADLSGADLSGADLSGAYLAGAHLDGADLSGADLFGAILFGADLSGAVFDGANLSGAVFDGADLSGADLSGADLSGAYLDGAVLGTETSD